MSTAKTDTCPRCGYCQHCGRGGPYWYPQPWYPQPWPSRPWWNTTTTNWTISDAGTGETTTTNVTWEVPSIFESQA